MKEIIEGGINYVVSDNYPELPYTKVIKHETPKENVITRLAFKRRFTMQELAAFKQLTKTDVQAEVFDDLISVAEDVTLDDPLLLSGMDYLVAQGILTAARKVEILA